MSSSTTMAGMPHRGFVKSLVLVASFLGFVLVLGATSRYGVGTSPDSVLYISAARNLASGHGYLVFTGMPLVYFPPLFPTLLAAFALVGFDPLEIARYVNAVAFGLVTLVAGMWLLRHIQSGVTVLFGTLAVLFSPPLLVISAYAWSEGVFILLILLFIVTIESSLKTGRYSLLFLAGTFAALSALERYIGVTTIVTGGALLLLRRGTARRKKFVDAATFTVIASGPLGIWMVRNILVSATATGVRWPSPYAPLQHVYYLLDTVTSWFLPSSSLFDVAKLSVLPPLLRTPVRLLMLSLAQRFVLSSLLIIGMAGALMFILKPSRCYRERWLSAMPMWCFPIVYVSIFLITSFLHSGQEPINNRYMSPIYVPLIGVIALFIDTSSDFMRMHFRSRVPAWFMLGACCLWLVYPITIGSSKVIYQAHNGAGGYASQLWTDSELMAYLKCHRLAGPLYTNAPYALYIHTGISAQASPRKYDYQTHDLVAADLIQFKTALASTGEAYIAWFDNNDKSNMYEVHELSTVFDVTVVLNTRDGAVYRVKLRLPHRV